MEVLGGNSQVKSFVKGTVALLLGAVMVFAIAAPASAWNWVYIKTFRATKSTYKAGGGGYAKVHLYQLTVAHPSNSKRQSVEFWGRVEDKCPADGKGAYFTLTAWAGSRKLHVWRATETRGCGGAGHIFGIMNHWYASPTGRFSDFTASICERDASGGGAPTCKSWDMVLK